MCVCVTVYGIRASTPQPLLRYPKRVLTSTYNDYCTPLVDSLSGPFPLLVMPMDSTVIALDRQCLGLRRRSQGPARGYVDWRLGEPAGPGGSGGSHWVQLVQVVSEGLKGGCDLIALYHRVDKAEDRLYAGTEDCVE